MACRTSVAVMLLLVSVASAGVQTPDTLALVSIYAGGRITESPVGPAGRRAWTPLFPRVPGWRDPDGVLPVRALNTRATLSGGGIRVEVSVLRGRVGLDVEEAIGTYEVTADRPETVDALRRVGLLPVTYAVKPFAAPAFGVPQASTRVDGVVIDAVEPAIDPVPAYRITVRNLTDAPVLTIAFAGYRGGRDAASGQQGDPAAVPIMTPGERFTFTLGITGGSPGDQTFATVQPFDALAITGVLWADGRTAGDPARTSQLLALHRGRLAALDVVVPALRAATTRADAEAIAAMRSVRAALDGMPAARDAAAVAQVIRDVPAVARLGPTDAAAVLDVGARNVRARMLADLDRVLASATPAMARQWLAEARDACEAWHARLSALFPAQP